MISYAHQRLSRDHPAPLLQTALSIQLFHNKASQIPPLFFKADNVCCLHTLVLLAPLTFVCRRVRSKKLVTYYYAGTSFWAGAIADVALAVSLTGTVAADGPCARQPECLTWPSLQFKLLPYNSCCRLALPALDSQASATMASSAQPLPALVTTTLFLNMWRHWERQGGGGICACLAFTLGAAIQLLMFIIPYCCC